MQHNQVGEGTTYDELLEFLVRHGVDLEEFERESKKSSRELHEDINKKETTLVIDRNTGRITQMSLRVRIVVPYRNFWLREIKRVYPKGEVLKGGLWISGSRIRDQGSVVTALRELEEEAGISLTAEQLDVDSLAHRSATEAKLRESTTYHGIYTLETIDWILARLDEKPSWLGEVRAVSDGCATLYLDWFEGDHYSGLR